MALTVTITSTTGSTKVLTNVEPGAWAAERWLTSLGDREAMGVADIRIEGRKVA